MNRITQEAKKRQGAVLWGMRHGKSDAARKYGVSLSSIKRWLDAFKKELGVEVGQTDANGLFSLTSLRCVGACGLAPVAMVNGKVFGRLAPANIKDIVKEYREME